MRLELYRRRDGYGRFCSIVETGGEHLKLQGERTRRDYSRMISANEKGRVGTTTCVTLMDPVHHRLHAVQPGLAVLLYLVLRVAAASSDYTFE